jgi:hypothetical protein
MTILLVRETLTHVFNSYIFTFHCCKLTNPSKNLLLITAVKSVRHLIVMRTFLNTLACEISAAPLKVVSL